MEKVIDKRKMIKRHILIDVDVYRKLCLIATEKYGSPTRKVFLVINEALKEYVDKYLKK